MLIGGIVIAVVVTVCAIALLTRRVAHDDVHSVEWYHRSLHTLESINAHPVISGGDESSGPGAKSAYPERAVGVASPSTGRRFRSMCIPRFRTGACENSPSSLWPSTGDSARTT